MNGKQYLKNSLPVILMNLLGMIALSLFLLAGGADMQTILFIAVVWVSVMICYMLVIYFSRKKYLNKLLDMTEQLEERYLITEVMKVPERADEQVFYQIMKMGEKSMLERIGRIEKERKEYKEYIEQWIHEAKTPITAMKLICENSCGERNDSECNCDDQNCGERNGGKWNGSEPDSSKQSSSKLDSSDTRALLAELEKMNRYTEQALYYARSEHTEKDYLIRETSLEDIIHGAIADNKYLLRQNHVAIVVDEMREHVYTDEKWVRFILDQIIGNAVKYRTEQPEIRFYAVQKADQIELSVEDNGVGIPRSDLPRIFEKGFTGSNGRSVQGSTGIGLYLCKRLCDKLGIGLRAYSEGEGAVIVLSFQINDYVAEVQG